MRVRVADLSSWKGLPDDDIVLRLWDLGLDYVEGPDSTIRRQDRKRVRRALEVPSNNQLSSTEYWEGLLGKNIDDINAILSKFGEPRFTEKIPLTFSAARVLTEFASSSERSTNASSKVNADNTLSRSPVQWKTVGREDRIEHLAFEEVRSIHYSLVKRAAGTDDPISPAGIRDEALLESALERPKTGIGRVAKYPTREMSAAALLHSLIHNHPFHNGNKRTALVSMLCLLDRNRLWLECDEQSLFQFVMRVSAHRLTVGHWTNTADAEVLAAAEWIHEQSRDAERGERRITGRELKQILRHFGCEIDHANRGNRILVRRQVERPMLLGLRRKKLLKHVVGYADDGRDISRGQLSLLRKELWLDAEHGIDSVAFYGRGEPVDSLINEYRQTLDRLARL